MTDTDPLVLFGENLRKLRKKVDINQEELAHRAGVDRTYVSGVEPKAMLDFPF
ncbi:MAG: helix-turn-helix domain-containing protein [Candidatus Eutrophobiaceae bacterium]